MKVDNNKFRFSRIVSRGFILGIFLSILMGPGSALASSLTDDPINCGEFVALVASHQPDNPLFPKNHSQLSKEELYLQTVQNMSGKGYRVLDKKSFYDFLEPNDFVQVSYAFADGPLGKNLFEQKLFLKQAGVIDSADVGLTTGYDGKVYQTHQAEKFGKPVKLATPVYMHDRIKTELLAKATFTFDDKSTLTMAEDSVVNITKHIYDPEKDLRQTIVHLSRGSVRFVVTKGKARGSMFKVITPTAIAGVRGTEFVVSVDPDGKTTFLVLEGQIETKPLVPGVSETKISLISAGESQDVSKNGIAAEVKQATPGLLRAYVAKTSKPGLTMVNNVWPSHVALKKVQRLAFMQGKMNKGVKKAKLDKGMKSRVLKLANNNALYDAKALGKRFEKTIGAKSKKLMPQDSGKANAKANAKSNAKANAKSNAKANAKSNAKQAAKQVAQENGKGKAKGKGKP
jgi:hypothetical protein